MHQVINKKIISVYLGRWEDRPGIDMPGITGPTWHYVDAFIFVEGGTILRLVPWEITIVNSISAEAKLLDLRDDHKIGCVGLKIVDVLSADSETHVVALNDGRYIRNSLSFPGGTSLLLGRFNEWEKEQLNVPAKSIATEEMVNLSQYCRKA